MAQRVLQDLQPERLGQKKGQYRRIMQNDIAFGCLLDQAFENSSKTVNEGVRDENSGVADLQRFLSSNEVSGASVKKGVVFLLNRSRKLESLLLATDLVEKQVRKRSEGWRHLVEASLEIEKSTIEGMRKARTRLRAMKQSGSAESSTTRSDMIRAAVAPYESLLKRIGDFRRR